MCTVFSTLDCCLKSKPVEQTFVPYQFGCGRLSILAARTTTRIIWEVSTSINLMFPQDAPDGKNTFPEEKNVRNSEKTDPKEQIGRKDIRHDLVCGTNMTMIKFWLCTCIWNVANMQPGRISYIYVLDVHRDESAGQWTCLRSMLYIPNQLCPQKGGIWAYKPSKQ